MPNTLRRAAHCRRRRLRRLQSLGLLVLPLWLTACGGSGDGDDAPPPPPEPDCSVAGQQAWLRQDMNDWYFWTRLSPKPAPGAYTSVEGYFAALLYTGTDPDFPADRWSTFESTESFNAFYGDGRTLGYGLFVAGIEVSGRPDLPLRVRYTEPKSDAAAKGVARGDEVVAVNGVPAADLIAAGDFSVLSPARAGETITVVLRGDGGLRSVRLLASSYRLTPVTGASVVASPGGRKLGYVVVKDMVEQALSPLDAAFTQFRAAGVRDVVLDLRYNGGGLVSVAAALGSYVVGAPAVGLDFASLLFNDQQAATSNQRYAFVDYAAALGLRRVFVLTGPRTCSASEQVINGLRGVGVDVVAIGDTTCGKPVGFVPASHCGTTWSAVNFETVNQRFEGRYFDGFAATCAVADDLSRPLGSPGEALLSAARSYADSGVCPAPVFGAAASRRAAQGRRPVEAGERQGMIAR